MTASRLPDIKLFVTDYDRCAYTNINCTPQLLSKELIYIAKSNSYTAMYGCTHRTCAAYLITDCVSDSIAKLVEFSRNYPELHTDPNSYFASSITRNLVFATGLTCIAVSTPDDQTFDGNPAQRCGMAYEHVLKVYENELMQKNNLREVSDRKPYVMHDLETQYAFLPPSQNVDELYLDHKNLQLLQIARHAQVIYGKDRIIELHFFDDVARICEQLANLPAMLLGPNVIIKSFNHNPAGNIFADIKSPTCVVSGVNNDLFKLCLFNNTTRRNSDDVTHRYSSLINRPGRII